MAHAMDRIPTQDLCICAWIALVPCLQLARACKLLDLGELIVVLQAAWIEEGARRLDSFSRYNLFHRKLHFLQVDCGLATVSCLSMQAVASQNLLGFQGFQK